MTPITRLAAALACLLALSGPAMAVLGGTEASVAADRIQMKASSRVISANLYTVQEIQGAAGTVVREYVTPQGLVFAVAWQGQTMPDLEQILGSYFTDYTNAAASRRSRHGPVQVQQSGLVVQSGGHMRAFSGRAYLLPLLPAGVSVDEIK